MRVILGLLALASLVCGLTVAVMHFQGNLDNPTYKDYFLVSSAAWFVFALAWGVKGRRRAR